jgi:hypothetical protein
MPTINDDKMTFIHIPKTAGASITVWYSKNILKTKTGYYKSSLSDHNFLSEIENPAPITIAIVRNPWDRMVSMYMFIKKMKMNITTANFDEFVLHDCKSILFDKYILSTPQIRWIEPGVTHLLRFENLEQDFKIIQDIFQCYEPLPVCNKTNHYHYRTYYNDETRQAVAEMFKEDIEAFGYEF